MIKKAADRKVEIRENMRGGAGRITFQHFFQQDEMTAGMRLCAQLVIPPGAGIGPHTHAEEDEVYIIIRGTGILDDGTTQTSVTAGDSILTGNGESHAIRNEGDENLELIAVIACY